MLPLGCTRKPIEDEDGFTLTADPLTFICTDALPSVNISFGAVSVGIVCPALKICPGISFFPCPSTRHT